MNMFLFPEANKRTGFILTFILFLYVIAGAFGVIHHEMWRDELDPWLTVCACDSLSDFFRIMGQGTNPYIWYLLLFFLSKITIDPVILQAAHLAVAVGSSYLLLRFSPFSVLQKFLLVFSYYFLFEYGIIGRGYALSIFFVFLFCTVWSRPTVNNVALVMVLFFLANAAGAFGAIIAIAFLLMYFSSLLFKRSSGGISNSEARNLGWVFLFSAISIWIAIRSISPPAGSVFEGQWFMGLDPERAMNVLWRVWSGYVPIPDIGSAHFWNTNILDTHNPTTFARIFLTVLSLIFILYGLIYFSKNVLIFIFFITGTLGVLFFSYSGNIIYFINGARYNGFLFVVFVASYWLLNGVAGNQHKRIGSLVYLGEKAGIYKFSNLYLLFLLLSNTFAGSFIYVKDMKGEFSSLTRTGKYIVENDLRKYRMTGFVDYVIAPISAYTHKPIYFPERDSSGTFPLWTSRNFTNDREKIIDRLVHFIGKEHDTVLVVLNFELGREILRDVHLKFITSVKGGIVPDENYFLYLAARYDLDSDLRNLAILPDRKQLQDYVSLAGDFLKQNNIAASGKILAAIKSRETLEPVERYHLYTGMLSMRYNDLSGAKAEFMKEINVNLQKDEAYFQLGMLYHQEQKIDSSIFCLSESVKLNPKNADFWSNLGVVYFNMKKDYQRAEEAWKNAIEIDPQFHQIYVYLMFNCKAQNNTECFSRYLRSALQNGMSIGEIRSKGVIVSDELLQSVMK